MLSNENDWTLPEPTPEPTPKKRGILFLSPEDIQELSDAYSKGLGLQDQQTPSEQIQEKSRKEPYFLH